MEKFSRTNLLFLKRIDLLCLRILTYFSLTTYTVTSKCGALHCTGLSFTFYVEINDHYCHLGPVLLGPSLLSCCIWAQKPYFCGATRKHVIFFLTPSTTPFFGNASWFPHMIGPFVPNFIKIGQLVQKDTFGWGTPSPWGEWGGNSKNR